MSSRGTVEVVFMLFGAFLVNRPALRPFCVRTSWRGRGFV